MDKGIPHTSLCSLSFEENEFSHLLGLIQLLLALGFPQEWSIQHSDSVFYSAWGGIASVMLPITIGLKLCVTVLVSYSSYA